MKLKQTFLLAVGAVLSVFCVGHAYADTTFDSYVQTSVRIGEITKRVSKNAAAAAGQRALGPGDTVYFDVKLKDTGASFTFVGNKYDTATPSAQDRPYLELNIPLRGQSTKNGIADSELVAGEAKSVETASAVAYYIGQGSDAATLRFAYEVRPGDMTNLLTWATTDTGEPIFGGTLAAIRVSGTLNPTPGTQTTGLTAQTLAPAADATLADENATRPWTVSGYVFTIGASYQDGGLVANDQDLSFGSLYQGLVPVMVSTRDGAAAATFSTTTLSTKCYFWVEAWDAGTNSWKYAPAGVTVLRTDGDEIKSGAFGTPLSDTFSTAYAAKFNGPTSASATAFATQTFFVNIPADIPAGTKMRLCYGVRRDATETATLFASQEVELQASPVIEANAKGYTVESYEMETSADGNITIPNDGSILDAYTNLGAVPGGEIKLAAGDPAVSITISKSRLNGYGTVYASIEMISKVDGARCTPNRYYIPLDSQSTTDYTLNLSVAENATGGETYFRICVPQLEAADTTTADEPFYLKVTSSRKRAKISLTAGDAGSLGQEYALGADSAETILKYTLSVEKTEQSARYFRIAPVTSDGTFIPETAVFAGGEGRNVLDAIKEYACLLKTAGGNPTTTGVSWLVVTLPSNAASVDFYIACMNDFPQDYLSGATIEWTEGATTVTKTLPAGGVLFSAASCGSNGTNVNTMDVCEVMAQPDVLNRTPVISNDNAPTGGSTGTSLRFSFTVTDAPSDYLVMKMDYGEGDPELYLYADEARMVALMGQAAWTALVGQLERDYGATAGSFANGGTNRKTRNAKGQENVAFTKVYSETANPSWIFTVYDPNSAMDYRRGDISLTSSQIFTFYTVKTATRPGTGYIRWSGQTSTPDDLGFGWTFQNSYTWAGKAKSGSNTTVMVEAVPFAAGATSPTGYTAISTTRDSFFYRWGARHTDYEALLPTNAEDLYDSTLAINRAFVSGGGQADDPTKWQDIILEAVFVAEYLPGDARTAFTGEPPTPYLYSFGDFNSDGVPDGWILRNVGADDAGRAIVESTTSQANTMPTEDYIPYTGFAGGDDAYRFGASDGRLGYGLDGGPTMQAAGCTPFGYKLRIRGRDEALNAADGEGNWLSNPAWVVLMHPEKTIDGRVVAAPGTIDGDTGVFSIEWKQVRLNTSGTTEEVGVTVAFTPANRIPYSAGEVDAEGWAPVIDEAGCPIKAGSTGYAATNIQVQTRPGDDNYECFRYTYTRWAVNETVKGEEDDALFPFTTKADSDAAMASGKVDEFSGRGFRGTYYFIDARVPAGMLIDEPFYTDNGHRTNGALDPRKTSWLSRFSNINSKDQDSDGISDAAEYFFWYYASRIAWGSVYKNDDGVQLNTALWPAVDLRNRSEVNSDATFGTTEQFTLGRRYRSSYDPDAADKAYYTVDQETGDVLVHENASFGKGNYWETIPVADVLAAFDPYVAAKRDTDTDNDGLLNVEEFAAGTNPLDCDTDDDWMTDGWEVKYGLNPLNLIVGDRISSDAEGNPDSDYFARAIVRTYPTYHHLFKVQVTTSIGGAGDASPFPIVGGGVDYYYDYESKLFRAIRESVANDPTRLTERNIGTWTLSWDEGKDFVTGWVNEPARFLEFEGEVKIIRDNAVYQAFGFHPGTAWGVRVLGHTALGSKLENFKTVNTLPFTNREEFASGARRGDVMSQSTSPKSADTNEDGVADGWEAYVGLKPYVIPNTIPDGDQDQDVDGMNARAEFQSRATHIYGTTVGWPDSLQSETVYDTEWVNKVLPSDPWNPDTDFDGLWDSAEKGPVTSRYANYSLTYNPTDGSTIGGGCDPCNIDTDGDGMPDGWEYRYCIINANTAAENDLSSSATVLRGPDPTDPTDYSIDYDRDGLTQYQEYLTGLLRHTRYDLNPDTARIYKDKPGVLGETVDGRYYWKTLPDVYNIFEDLANPEPVPSVDYVEAFNFTGSIATAGGAIVGTPEAFTVDPLVQAWAMTALHLEKVPTSTLLLQSDVAGPAISAAVSRKMMATTIVPTPKQVSAYGLDATLVEPDDLAGLLISSEAERAFGDLQEYLQALDAAYYRLLANKDEAPAMATGYKGSLLFSQETDSDRDDATLRALIDRIDFTLAKLQGLVTEETSLQPVLRELLKSGGETETLWTARKKQIFKVLQNSVYAEPGVVGGTLPAPVDPVYAAMAAQSASFTLTDTNAIYGELDAADVGDYEAALASATCPLLKTAYRSALRGYTGGVREKNLWGPFSEDGTTQVSYLAPLGVHYPFKTLEQRQESFERSAVKRFLGLPLTSGGLIGARAVQFDAYTDTYATTSPLVADSDADGMDDYWEVFHGLNPILGDYNNTHSANGDAEDRGNYIYNKIRAAYTPQSVTAGAMTNTVFSDPRPTGNGNPFGAPAFENGRVTGFDYYTYPWLAGVPFADPDGDGLLNAEEAVNPVAADPAHYGTDPSPLWMTDPDNTNSYTARFYGRINHNNVAVNSGLYLIEEDPAPAPDPNDPAAGADEEEEETTITLDPSDMMPSRRFSYYTDPNEPDVMPLTAHFLPYEINEGYDTDGDGVPDMVELTSGTIYRGDPQTLRTPDRQQAAYLGGKGVMQSFVTTQFGPMALTTFTLECWIKPEASQPGANADGEVILIDRPWRFNEGAEVLGDLRHNFRLGLKVTTGGFLPFVNYTGAGTALTGDNSAPQVSPTVTSTEAIKPGVWNHVAVTYDGKRMALILNGIENAAQASTLIPANGVISLKNDGLDEVQVYSYRNAPLMIGAEPSGTWFSELGDPEDENAFDDYYQGAYTGFIDEVRIWNGARTAAQIADKRSAGFTQAELLALRNDVFTARYNGNGYYEPNTPVQPLAIYTFNDLLAGGRVAATEDAPASAASEPWERYPGEKLVGGDDVSGSFTFRRSGFKETLAAIEAGEVPRVTAADYPTVEELYTSFYTLTAPKNLRSAFYCENSTAAQAGTEAPQSEFVPMAHNTIDHLPLADIRRKSRYNYRRYETINGSPSLEFPSGSTTNLKTADSVYWTPYAAGATVNSEATYNVKTTGNPYGYRHLGVMTFDADRYTTLSAFTTRYTADLLVYGDVFAKYDFESWDNSPSTDPSAGSGEGGSGTGEAGKPSGSDWFDYKNGGTDLSDKQFSNGGAWLEENIAVGQTKDSDSDRMPNWWENYYGLDPEDPTGLNGPHGDADGDFLTNYAEYLAKADPNKFSTVGNGVPDFHIPVWFRRGRPTFGLLYTDNDFMEDHWEAVNRSNLLNVDTYDAQGDADGDGWSNWAEARANFRSGEHSTNPNAATSISQNGEVVLEMPTPALRLTVDYFGNQDVYTNATENAKILVHAYTAKNNNSAPDATFKLPLSTSTESSSDGVTLKHEIGYWCRGTYSGYLHMGNIIPGSLEITYQRMLKNETSSTDNGTHTEQEYLYFTLMGDTVLDGDVAEIYYNRPVTYTDAEGNTVGNGTARVKAGTINYRTGFYTLDFTNESDWSDRMVYFDESTTGALSNIAFYDRTEFLGTASYKYGIIPGKSNTFTLVKPDSGYLKEGANNFFVFADLNGNGTWNDGEPAGVPDQHDVDIGFDQVNKPLHVALTTKAPAGAVRLDVKSILGVLITEDNTNDAVQGDNSSLTNPTTKQPLQPSLFNTGLDYYLVLTDFENISTGNPTTNPGAVVYETLYNTKKPYLTEDEIFGYSASGLPGTEASNQKAASYKVYLLPSTVKENDSSMWTNYNIAVVTNHFTELDAPSTKMVSPIGGAVRGNTELTFEWLSNVQVPTFTLKITKVEDAVGNAINKVVYEKQVRGVTPCAVAKGADGSLMEQFTYRYQLPRGLGELNAAGDTVFGDGLYSYMLSLNPYNGTAHVLSGDFRIQLTDSGDPDLREVAEAEKDTSWNTQDSFYVRAKIRYTGVLVTDGLDGDFGGRRLMVEAHYSGSFNGDPVASTSDILAYDKLKDNGTYDDGTAEAPILKNRRNRCVRMVRDRFYPEAATVETAKFFGTRFDAELRGLPTADPVYLVAYFDLNGNGKRDAWEPWGYATQGLDATSGFYFDPLAVKPVNNGRDYQVEFYIQDVDTDNDKLADSWEWVSAGKPTADFDTWCDTFVGSAANHRANDIWVVSETGTLSLTAYGAQLFGLKATSAPDANGAVRVEGLPEDLATAQELMEMMDPDVALALTADGYTSYGLTVKSITTSGDAVTLAWDVTAALGVEDGATYDLTQVFADNSATTAVYAVYGKATLGDEAWTKLGEVQVANLTAPAIELPAEQIQIDGQPAAFFRIILSAKTAAKTLAE